MTTTTLRTARSELTFNPAAGGRMSLTAAGRAILREAPAFAASIGGQLITGWETVRAEVDGLRMVISGSIGDGIEAALTVTAFDAADAFEFALTLTRNNERMLGTGHREFGGGSVTLADSFSGLIAPGDWTGTHYTSIWGGEFGPHKFDLSRPRELETRTGRSSLDQHPWISIERSGGGALIVSPAWSGNWHIGLTPNAQGTFVSAGISPWKFAHQLKEGRPFEAPAVFVSTGLDAEDAALSMQRAIAQRIPRSSASEAIPVEWNHWWPYRDAEISEEVFLANVEQAKDLGIEICTLDAGWFGPSVIDSKWWDYRGDFFDQNVARFPNGVRWLSDETRKRGVKFGIWIEIEAIGLAAHTRTDKPHIMARRDDDLPQKPLDPNDPGFLGYVCFGSPEGRQHALDTLENLVAISGCEWLKIDFNLNPGAGCSCADHGHGPGDGLYAHVRGLYEVFDTFRARHPEVIVENCASGGLRNDAGLAQHMHCAFLSDPDWPTHHLECLHGASQMLPPAAILNFTFSQWTSNDITAEQTLALHSDEMTDDRFDNVVLAAFPHRMGISWRLPDLKDHLKQRLKRLLALYKGTVRDFVRGGITHRLTPTPLRSGAGEIAPMFQLQKDDRHLVVGVRLDYATGKGFDARPVSLAPDRQYRVSDLALDASTPDLVRSGSELMRGGLPRTDRSSAIYLIEPA
jgi:alpha-galactosidase